MAPNRPITVNGSNVILHAWKYQPQEEKYDYSKRVSVIEGLVKKMFSNSSVAPIYIEGAPGSGKSTLAEVLKVNGSNVEIIDALKEKHVGNALPSALISNPSTTYIIDHAEFSDMGMIIKANQHADNGGLVILLVQDVRDLGGKVNFETNAKPYFLALSNYQLVTLENESF